MKKAKVFFWIVLTVAAVTASVVGLAREDSVSIPESRADICSGLPETRGLVMDGRRNLYTAEPATGYIYCIPPEGDPLVCARVPGTPDKLAVDRQRTPYVSNMRGIVYAVSRSGEVRECYRSGERVLGLSTDRDGGLIIATAQGTIRKVDASDLQ